MHKTLTPPSLSSSLWLPTAASIHHCVGKRALSITLSPHPDPTPKNKYSHTHKHTAVGDRVKNGRRTPFAGRVTSTRALWPFSCPLLTPFQQSRARKTIFFYATTVVFGHIITVALYQWGSLSLAVVHSFCPLGSSQKRDTLTRRFSPMFLLTDTHHITIPDTAPGTSKLSVSIIWYILLTTDGYITL